MRLVIGERQLLEVRVEIVAHVVFDVPRRADQDAAHQKPEQAAHDADGEQERPVLDELGPGDAARQVVDRVTQDHRRGERHGLGADHADEADQEIAAVAYDVAEQSSKRRHGLV